MYSTIFRARAVLTGGLLVGALSMAAPAGAEPFLLQDCDGVYGIGVIGYSKIESPQVATLTELSEVCWNEETATLTSQEQSRNLELIARQGATLQYQRLEGGSVSPVNERLDVRPWSGGPDAPSYFRWTTESSRSREELRGYDYVSVEGFVLGVRGFAPQPETASYDVEMMLTGIGGSGPALTLNMLLPMEGTVALDGNDLSLTLGSFMPGMMVGSVALEADLSLAEAHPTGTMTLVLENELIAGAPDQMWKRLELRLDEMAVLFSGDDIALVGGLTGEMTSFGGDTSPVTFTVLASGPKS